MPVQYETIPIPFVRGLDEKSDAKFAQPPSLLEAKNCEIDKMGRISKRRGFLRIDVTNEAFNRSALERVYHTVTTYQDELLVFGFDYASSIVSKTEDVGDGRGAVRIGDVIRGTIRLQDVTGSGGDEASHTEG